MPCLPASLSFPLLALIALAACERPERSDQPIPAGVSVDPPRTAPAAGGLAVPGVEPDSPLVRAPDQAAAPEQSAAPAQQQPAAVDTPAPAETPVQPETP